jgi:ribosomal-protein-alanine N-acetyltransferase
MLRDEFPFPYTALAAQQWISIVKDENPTTNFAIIYKGAAIGGVGIKIQTDIFRKNAEIGYWLGEKYWNKGISTKALKVMVQYTFERFDINRIFAHVFESNISSIRVLHKCGFSEETCLKKSIIKNNKIQDCYIYSIHKQNVLLSDSSK